jgi:LmbE family N-acetylglucosaminyl deacetylase
MAEFEKLLYAEKPDIVFTHWPVDSHKDHQLASVLTIQSWLKATEKFTLYFYEVCIGEQSFLFILQIMLISPKHRNKKEKRCTLM